MDHDVNADPNSNYKILAEQLQYAKEKHLPTRKLKFNKNKHKHKHLCVHCCSNTHLHEYRYVLVSF